MSVALGSRRVSIIVNRIIRGPTTVVSASSGSYNTCTAIIVIVLNTSSVTIILKEIVGVMSSPTLDRRLRHNRTSEVKIIEKAFYRML